MNYLPNGIAQVIRDQANRVVKVVAVYRGQKVPFIMTWGKVVREDYFKARRPVIPTGHYGRMYRQVTAIFSENKTKQRSEDLAWLLNDLAECGVTLKGQGRLEITRWDKLAGKKPKLVRQTVDDILTAIRMQGHIIDNYSLTGGERQGELDKLESIELVVARATQILHGWLALKDADKTKLQKELAAVVLKLEFCRNEFKVAAREQTEKVIPLKDSLGRPNPMAFASRTVAALDDLTKRIRQLNIIMPYIAMRKQLLVLADRWLRAVFKQTAGIITLIKRHRVFSGGSLADYEPKIIGQKLDQALCLLNNAVIAPYYAQAGKARAELRRAKKLFLEKQYPACQEKLGLALDSLVVPAN